MSYTLDALRKSESERQRDAGSGLARTPVAVASRRTPSWTYIVIGLLSIALIGLGIVWWRGDAPALPPTASEPAPDPRFEPAPGPASVPLAETAAPQAAAPQAAAAGGAPAAATSTAPAPATATIPLRSIGELPDFGPTLPEYRLEVLACCSDDPAQNSAWINGRRYYPGERIGSGPVVAEVRSDGVVLAFAGQRFLLTTR